MHNPHQWFCCWCNLLFSYVLMASFTRFRYHHIRYYMNSNIKYILAKLTKCLHFPCSTWIYGSTNVYFCFLLFYSVFFPQKNVQTMLVKLAQSVNVWGNSLISIKPKTIHYILRQRTMLYKKNIKYQ